MASDPNKKTLRHFYCRDSLWQSFERMSEDMDRGVDELVSEAMRLFAGDKGYVSLERESHQAPAFSGHQAPAFGGHSAPAPGGPPRPPPLPLPPPMRPSVSAGFPAIP